MKQLIKRILREETNSVRIRKYEPDTDFEKIYNNLGLVDLWKSFPQENVRNTPKRPPDG